MQRHIVLRLSDRSSVKRLVNTNQLILVQIGSSGPRGKSMKRSTFGVRRSKVKRRTRPEIDSEAWPGHRCQQPLVE